MDTSGLPDSGEFRCILFGIHRNLMFLEHPDVSGMYGFMHIHRNSTISSNPDVFLSFSGVNSLFSVEFVNP